MGIFMRSLSIVICLVGWTALGMAANSDSEIMTNQHVIDLLKAKLSTQLVIDKITASDNAFDVSTEAMINLKTAGVPEDIISVMLMQVRSKRSRIESRIKMEIQNLASGQPAISDSALVNLKRLGSMTYPALRKALTNTRPEVRAAAAKGLGELGDTQGARFLRMLLVDSVATVRYSTAEALHKLNDKPSLEVAQRALVGNIRPLDGYIRLLGYFKHAPSANYLQVRLLEDSDGNTRAQSAWALGKLNMAGSRKNIEHVLLSDQTTEVRRQAAIALGEMKNSESIQALIRSCKTDPVIRKETILSLGIFPAKSVVPFLISTIKQKLSAEEKDAVLSSLRRLTHQDLGFDHQRWQTWLEINGERLGVLQPDAPSPEEEKLPGIVNDIPTGGLTPPPEKDPGELVVPPLPPAERKSPDSQIPPPPPPPEVPAPEKSRIPPPALKEEFGDLNRGKMDAVDAEAASIIEQARALVHRRNEKLSPMTPAGIAPPPGNVIVPGVGDFSSRATTKKKELLTISDPLPGKLIIPARPVAEESDTTIADTSELAVPLIRPQDIEQKQAEARLPAEEVVPSIEPEVKMPEPELSAEVVVPAIPVNQKQLNVVPPPEMPSKDKPRSFSTDDYDKE